MQTIFFPQKVCLPFVGFFKTCLASVERLWNLSQLLKGKIKTLIVWDRKGRQRHTHSVIESLPLHVTQNNLTGLLLFLVIIFSPFFLLQVTFKKGWYFEYRNADLIWPDVLIWRCMHPWHLHKTNLTFCFLCKSSWQSVEMPYLSRKLEWLEESDPLELHL